jgi:hypothetical protein
MGRLAASLNLSPYLPLYLRCRHEANHADVIGLLCLCVVLIRFLARHRFLHQPRLRKMAGLSITCYVGQAIV